ncbi:multiple epidermal growth factor-like domains protein 11 [Biomphalaria glabrata]
MANGATTVQRRACSVRWSVTSSMESATSAPWATCTATAPRGSVIKIVLNLHMEKCANLNVKKNAEAIAQRDSMAHAQRVNLGNGAKAALKIALPFVTANAPQIRDTAHHACQGTKMSRANPLVVRWNVPTVATVRTANKCARPTVLRFVTRKQARARSVKRATSTLKAPKTAKIPVLQCFTGTVVKVPAKRSVVWSA